MNKHKKLLASADLSRTPPASAKVGGAPRLSAILTSAPSCTVIHRQYKKKDLGMKDNKGGKK